MPLQSGARAQFGRASLLVCHSLPASVLDRIIAFMLARKCVVPAVGAQRLPFFGTHEKAVAAIVALSNAYSPSAMSSLGDVRINWGRSNTRHRPCPTGRRTTSAAAVLHLLESLPVFVVGRAAAAGSAPCKSATASAEAAATTAAMNSPISCSLRETPPISDPKVNFSYFEIAMGRYGEVWARRNVYSAPPRYYKCTATHATPI